LNNILKEQKYNSADTKSRLNNIDNNINNTNNKLNTINSKIDTTNNKLNSVDDKLSILTTVSNVVSNPSSIGDSVNSTLNDGFDTYLNKDYTGGLATSSCPSIKTFSIVFHGKTITILSQKTLDNMPMNIFRSMIIFMFVFSGIIFALRTS